jgi:hypothetical protein
MVWLWRASISTVTWDRVILHYLRLAVIKEILELISGSPSMFTCRYRRRALADQYIESCDQNIDRQDQAAQQAVIRSEQLAAQQAELAQRFEQQKVEQARARAELHSRELVMCNSVGGRLENERCYSTVKGDPSGTPGADCTSMNGTPIWLSFAKSGEFLSGFYSTTKTFYPGCFR